MPNWQPNWKDVVWDWGVANDAVRALQRAADLLDATAGERSNRSQAATAEWRGRYRDNFEGELRRILTRSRDLATHYREIASRISQASQRAHDEQKDRERERQRWWRQYWAEQAGRD